MLIANPIYDTVFKYLMDDSKVARLLLSAIIGEEIISLEHRPTEIKSETSVTVYHIDFSAKIRYADGSEKLVILEIQKAKLATDIMRFRKYLGLQYYDSNNVQVVCEPEVVYQTGLPIISIYFLGHKLDNIKAAVIKVQREYIDLTTGNTIQQREYFIESLTHDSFVIQIPYLKDNRKTELLRVLSIFDQSNRELDIHILNVSQEDFPEKYRPIIRRLQMANSEADVRHNMNIEDLYINDYKENERLLEQMKTTIEENNKALANKDKALTKKDKALANTKKALTDKDKALSDKDKALADSKKTIEELEKQLEKLRGRR